MHCEYIILSEWWMDEPISKHSWAWSSSGPSYLVLPLSICSFHLKKTEGRQELCQAPGQVGCEWKEPRSASFPSQALSAGPAALLLADSDPRPSGASLCPLEGNWGEGLALTGGHSPLLPCPRLSPEQMDLFICNPGAATPLENKIQLYIKKGFFYFFFLF